MAPYLAILERAKAAGAGLNASETVDQSGFQQLMEIEQVSWRMQPLQGLCFEVFAGLKVSCTHA
jgi:hypothetical protein